MRYSSDVLLAVSSRWRYCCCLCFCLSVSLSVCLSCVHRSLKLHLRSASRHLLVVPRFQLDTIRPSHLRCRWTNDIELVPKQFAWAGHANWLFSSYTEDVSFLSVVGTLSALEAFFCDHALYKLTFILHLHYVRVLVGRHAVYRWTYVSSTESLTEGFCLSVCLAVAVQCITMLNLTTTIPRQVFFLFGFGRIECLSLFVCLFLCLSVSTSVSLCVCVTWNWVTAAMTLWN